MPEELPALPSVTTVPDIEALSVMSPLVVVIEFCPVALTAPSTVMKLVFVRLKFPAMLLAFKLTPVPLVSVAFPLAVLTVRLLVERLEVILLVPVPLVVNETF